MLLPVHRCCGASRDARYLRTGTHASLAGTRRHYRDYIWLPFSCRYKPFSFEHWQTYVRLRRPAS